MCRGRALLLLILLPLSCLTASTAQAQERPRRLVLEAPPPLQVLLQRQVAALADVTELPQDEADRLALIRRIRREATEILATEGYFTPELRVARGEAGRVLRVEPGPRAKVTALDLAFEGGLAGTGEALEARRTALRQGWELPQGKPFRQEDWDRAKQALLEAVSGRDYPVAVLRHSRAEVDPEAATVKLAVVVDSGPAVVLGDLHISGLRDYPEDLLRRLHPPQAGDPYDRERLLAYQSAVQDTPYFASVSVEADLDGVDARAPGPQTAPLRVTVSEANPRRVSLGAGYSSNYGARGEVGYRDSNLAGSAWDLVSGLRLEQRHQVIFADLFRPPTGEPYQDSLGAQAERSDIEGLRLTTRAVGAVRSFRMGDAEVAVTTKLQREDREPDGAPSSTQSALSLNGAWTWRAVDNLLDPRRGLVMTAEVGGASRALISDRNFLRLYGRMVGYLPVTDRDVLILRAEGGITLATSREGIPQDFLFRAGGSQSVRGYAYQSLGVKEGNAVVGGRYLATLSAEYDHWFLPDWGVAVFADAGNAADDRPAFRLLPGYGVGARWRSPAGPLALDVAYGQDERRTRLHFAIAIAF